MKNLIYLFITSILIFSCDTTTKEEVSEPKQISSNTIDTDKQMKKGFDVLSTNCISCHSPELNKADKIAPTIAEIKKSYTANNETKQDFISDFISFLENPTKEASKMSHAVKEYGLMPNMGFSNEQIKQVANYLFKQDVEDKNWYANVFSKEKEKYAHIKDDKISDIQRGKKFVLKTKPVLGKNLMGAIKKNGTDAALKFCNIKAFSLVDSMATLHNVKIKRVSDKARNSNNIANKEELAYILKLKNILAKGEKAKATISKQNDKFLAYYPIMTNDMCLQCHGTPKTQIKESTLSLISKMYPEDKAKNYKANELRGIWVIEFE